MKKYDLDYVTMRANQHPDGSINAVSCADIRALIAERAELLAALEALLTDVEFAQPQITEGLIGNRQIRAARESIAKAQG